MISIKNDEENIYFIYEPYDGSDWMREILNQNGEIQFKGLKLTKDDLLENEKDKNTYTFILGTKVDNCYKIKSNTICTNYDVFLSSICIFKRINRIFEKDNLFHKIEEIRDAKVPLYIGTDNCDITNDEFIKLVDEFPNNYEKKLYYDKKVQTVLENYFDDVVDKTSKFEKYIAKKECKQKLVYNLGLSTIYENDILKYEHILSILKSNMEEPDNISELMWKQLIAQIILLLFPQYINYHTESMIKLENNDRKKFREYFDFMLVKSDGAVDILEVKKPNCASIISLLQDHKNYYAATVLSKTLMQLEKYIHNLNRNAITCEKNFNEKYGAEYYDGFSFKILRPRGIVIIGDTRLYNTEQRNDLEIIRRMYCDIVDIYTYDDLINMLERQIQQIKKKQALM